MKFESDIELKHLERILKATPKIANLSLPEAHDLIVSVDFFVRIINKLKEPNPLPMVSQDQIGKSVTPIKMDPTKGKKK